MVNERGRNVCSKKLPNDFHERTVEDANAYPADVATPRQGRTWQASPFNNACTCSIPPGRRPPAAAKPWHPAHGGSQREGHRADNQGHPSTTQPATRARARARLVHGQLGVGGAQERRPAREGGQQVRQPERQDGARDGGRRGVRAAGARRHVLDPVGEDQIDLERDHACRQVGSIRLTRLTGVGGANYLVWPAKHRLWAADTVSHAQHSKL